MKFLVKSLSSPVQYEGGAQVYGTGPTPFINNSEDLLAIPVGKDKVRFVTGLNENDIKSNILLTDEEKEAYLKLVAPAREKVREAFGEDALDFSNTTVWGGARANLKVDNNLFSSVFDEANVEDLIFRMQVIGGGYSLVAPTLDIAERTGKKFYLTDEDEFAEKGYEEEYGDKRKAIAALDEILEGKNLDALLYLTWNTIEGNHGFTRNTKKAVFEKALMDFIEGKAVKTGKKDCAKRFLKNYAQWKTDKEGVIAKAIMSAAVHFGEIYKDEGKFKTTNRMTTLGSTLEESLSLLMKAEHTNEFIEIKKVVEDKLKD